MVSTTDSHYFLFFSAYTLLFYKTMFTFANVFEE
nr:MAG TPA: hypothetical protein [Caudoviricetes sp.]